MLYITLSAVLFILSFSNPIFPQGLPGLAAVALIPSFIALSQTKFIKKAYYYGAWFGLLSTLGVYYWFKNYGEFALIITICVSFVYMVEYSALFTLIWLSIKRTAPLYRPLILACIWTGYEYVKSIGFLAFPWALLAHSVHDIPPLIQSAKIFGTWGISFILAYINAICFEMYLISFCKPIQYMHPKCIKSYRSHKYSTYKHSICCLGLVVFLLIFGSVELSKFKKSEPDSYLQVLLIQQNLDSWGGASPQESLSHVVNLTNDALNEIALQGEPRPSLIVWSESTLNVPYNFDTVPYAKEFYTTVPKEEPFVDFIKRINIPILTGTAWIDKLDKSKYYNGAIIIHPDGNINGFYGKNQLVPFAERIPFMEFQVFRDLMASIGLTGTWTPYGSFNTLNTTIDNQDGEYYSGELRIGIPICFEDSFSYVTRNFVWNGANLLANLTNVSWAKTPIAAHQQIIAAKFRNIETGLTSLRATNSGITSLIDPSGKILQAVSTFTPTYLYHKQVPLYFPKKVSTYILWGDYFGKLARLIAIIYVTILSISYLRAQKRYATWY